MYLHFKTTYEVLLHFAVIANTVDKFKNNFMYWHLFWVYFQWQMSFISVEEEFQMPGSVPICGKCFSFHLPGFKEHFYQDMYGAPYW